MIKIQKVIIGLAEEDALKEKERRGIGIGDRRNTEIPNDERAKKEENPATTKFPERGKSPN